MGARPAIFAAAALATTLLASCATESLFQPIALPPDTNSAAPGEPDSPFELRDALASGISERGGVGILMSGPQLDAAELPEVPPRPRKRA